MIVQKRDSNRIRHSVREGGRQDLSETKHGDHFRIADFPGVGTGKQNAVTLNHFVRLGVVGALKHKNNESDGNEIALLEPVGTKSHRKEVGARPLSCL